MIKFIASLLIVFSNYIYSAGDNMDELMFLRKGKNDLINWSLYKAPDGENQTNLVIVIKNIGSKAIDLEGVTTKNFSFITSSGKTMEVNRISGFDNIMYNEVIVAQICISGKMNKQETYIFEMKEKEKSFVPVSLKKINIQFLAIENKENKQLKKKTKQKDE